MTRYVLKRLLYIIPMLLLIVLIVFLILNITPGNPGRIMLGPNAEQYLVDELNESLGMNKPVLQRYLDYVLGIFKLDFGFSYRTQEPVFEEILGNFPTTIKLAVFSVIVSAFIGIPLGIISATKRYSAMDISSTVSALFLASIPEFWLGLIMMLIFSLKLGVLPAGGIGSIDHYILPVLTLSLPTAAYLLRITRTIMLEILREDYIRTAKAKGASNQRIIFKHAIRNALLPIITQLGIRFAYLLGGTLIVEAVFGMYGVGTVILRAMQLKDIPIIMGSTILLATLFMLIMLIIDLMYAYIDPRIKSQFKKGNS
ncbi:ABC transporter permease [Candidatus Izemoplasma sp. B36]|uniref:ABC transporter permease n=1 Tax=Candidatus Izemoplasma sp. B36 TaxID=3242468 RepID=UPI003557D6FB